MDNPWVTLVALRNPDLCAQPPNPGNGAQPPNPENGAQPPNSETGAQPPNPENCAQPPNPENGSQPPNPDNALNPNLMYAPNVPKHAACVEMSTHQRTVPFDTIRPEPEVNTNDVITPTSTTHKGTHGGMVNPRLEKITFGGRGKGPGKFREPGGVAVSRYNEIFVADGANERIQVFNINGVFLRLFPTVVPSRNKQKMNPSDVVIDGKGYVWVVGSDLDHEYLVKYSREGRLYV
ncbi:TRIM71 [Branchiostoma lanceolatum]|uniref:TRIM71 protein n=1 Tax=Branchiostoma lanceolatum TaxID=7740 RepID=A0A8J9W754_BRALA|nr:TRIM71 [Branchiostoma lanceolatum]